MKTRLLVLGLVAALAITADAPAARYSRGRGGGYGYGYGNPFGSYLQGMASYTNSLGQAATNYQNAYQHSIENRKLYAQTYFDMRRMNASYRAEMAMQHPPATADEIAAFNQARLPKPLSPNDFDPEHGVFEWPGLLTRTEFDHDRAQLEGLFTQAAADPHGSGLGTQNYRDIQHAVGAMNDTLHSEIKDFSPKEYIAASKFLKSLAYQAGMPSSIAVAKK
jgi:hypothetical protein